MNRLLRAGDDDRGAILVHTAIALLALVAFTTFVADYGVFWASRRQAQNSADAAALAGAVALAFDNAADLSDTGPAKESAFAESQRNFIFGQPPDVQHTDISFGTCPDGSANCIRVDVYRSAQRGNPLPMFFGYFVGLTSQSVQATATAEVHYDNASDCLKPWAVIDKWDEHWPDDPAPWTTDSTYDRYDKKGNPDPSITTPDVYIPPSEESFGTGFHPYEADGVTYTSDYGRRLALKVGNAGTDWDYAAGWFSALNLFDSRGGNDYRNNIKGCIGVTYKIGDELPIDTAPGNKVGPTSQATATDTDSLINQDPGAYWDTSLNGGRGGVAGSAFPSSPRIVAIPLVNPDAMILANKNGLATVPLANIAGFFVDSYDNSSKSVIGYLVTMQGKYVPGGGAPGPGGTFLRSIQLVR